MKQNNENSFNDKLGAQSLCASKHDSDMVKSWFGDLKIRQNRQLQRTGKK